MVDPKPSRNNNMVVGSVLASILAVVAGITLSPENSVEVSVQGPSTAEVGKQVVLRAEGNAVRYIWDYDPLLAPYEGCENRDFVFSCTVPGEYAITLVGTSGDIPAKYRHTIRIGGTGPTPPGPGPGPGPKPPVPPIPVPVVTELPFQVTIIHESADDTVEQARLWSLLRSGTAAAYLKGKGHTLNILDDDTPDSKGAPSPAVTQWAPFTEGLPTVVIADKNGKLIHRYKLPFEPNKPIPVETILDELKKRGG